MDTDNLSKLKQLQDMLSKFDAETKKMLDDLGKDSMFKCPHCGKEHPLNKAKIEKILASSEHIDTKIKGRSVVRTYRDSYYNVRFCEKCYNRKKITKKVLYCSIFVIGTILYIINYIESIGDIAFLLLFWLYMLFGIGILNWVLDKTIYDVDFEDANKNNAIAPRSSIFDK